MPEKQGSWVSGRSSVSNKSTRIVQGGEELMFDYGVGRYCSMKAFAKGDVLVEQALRNADHVQRTGLTETGGRLRGGRRARKERRCHRIRAISAQMLHFAGAVTCSTHSTS